MKLLKKQSLNNHKLYKLVKGTGKVIWILVKTLKVLLKQIQKTTKPYTLITEFYMISFNIKSNSFKKRSSDNETEMTRNQV